MTETNNPASPLARTTGKIGPVRLARAVSQPPQSSHDSQGGMTAHWREAAPGVPEHEHVWERCATCDDGSLVCVEHPVPFPHEEGPAENDGLLTPDFSEIAVVDDRRREPWFRKARPEYLCQWCGRWHRTWSKIGQAHDPRIAGPSKDRPS